MTVRDHPHLKRFRSAWRGLLSRVGGSYRRRICHHFPQRCLMGVPSVLPTCHDTDGDRKVDTKLLSRLTLQDGNGDGVVCRGGGDYVVMHVERAETLSATAALAVNDETRLDAAAEVCRQL